MKPLESTALLLLGISSVVAFTAAPRAPLIAPAPPVAATAPAPRPVLALHAALANERRSAALYEATARRHPEVLLFALLRDAETVHVARVLDLFVRYDLEVPPNPEDPEKIPVPARVAAACAAGADNERATITLFDGLIGEVNSVDVRETFSALRDASRDRHLPALERCAMRRGAP